MQAKVLVAGSYNQDLTWDTPAFPVPGQTVVGRFRSGPGGKGSNQAVAAARCGAPTVFVGAVGDDVFGQAVRDFYAREGIECCLAVKKGTPTGTAGIWVNGEGQNSIIVALGANGLLEAADIPDSKLREAGVVVCQHEVPQAFNLELFRRSRKVGHAVTILNPAPMVADFDPAILEYTDLFTPNETEFLTTLKQLGVQGGIDLNEEALKEIDPSALHRLCRKIPVPVTLITLGKRGCFVSEKDNFWSVPALSGVQAVDTTGAGDAFMGGLACGLLRFNRELETAIRFATVVAGLAVTRRGAAAAMPMKNEVDALWNNGSSTGG